MVNERINLEKTETFQNIRNALSPDETFSATLKQKEFRFTTTITFSRNIAKAVS